MLLLVNLKLMRTRKIYYRAYIAHGDLFLLLQPRPRALMIRCAVSPLGFRGRGASRL